jgi:hypothetical protein
MAPKGAPKAPSVFTLAKLATRGGLMHREETLYLDEL